MRTSRHQLRMIFSAVVLLAFFIPAYKQVSAFGFLRLAIVAPNSDAEVTWIDVLMLVLPLLAVPVTAVIILLRTIKRKPSRSLLLSLPLICIAFIFLILSFSISRELNTENGIGIVKEMSYGFYIAAFASVLLRLSYNKRESLQNRLGRR